jgi:hypothetical protein
MYPFLKPKLYATILFLLLLFIQTTLNAQVPGCTDPAANNYNDTATVNDGSCTYKNISITPTLNTNLNAAVNETSGLLWWNRLVWTHNDSDGKPDIYAIDNTNGNVIRTVVLTNATNQDWEDITQDDKYMYIGDMGNNLSGNRTDLRIYRIKKSDVKKDSVVKAGIIRFSYSDQTDIKPKDINKTDFDCEAIIAYGDSLFLFSKDWVDNKTRLYKLPKTPGTYVAEKIGELDVKGLITGAEIVPDKRVIVLTGYDVLVTPFIYLLYDFTGNSFFDANKRKVGLNQPFTQVEGICSVNGKFFYISNERFEKLFTVPAKLQTINLAPLLNPYYNSSLKKTFPGTTANNYSSQSISPFKSRLQTAVK